ncbi:MAG: hypothetical protein EPO68_00700 [Planctomycetota bacterium]|nr:MAG: hypothetical protein EPO68_00700 [Planctomycetota bacterium]
MSKLLLRSFRSPRNSGLALAALAWAALASSAALAAQDQVALTGPAELSWQQRIDEQGPLTDGFRAIAEHGGTSYCAGYSFHGAQGPRLLVAAREIGGAGAAIWELSLPTAHEVQSSERVACALSADAQLLFVAHSISAPQTSTSHGALTCIDAANGSVRWTASTAVAKTHFDALALASDAQRVYAGGVRDGSSTTQILGVACFDAATGAELWSRSAEDVLSHSAPALSLAVDASGTRVYHGGFRRIEALAASSGAVIWSKSVAESAPAAFTQIAAYTYIGNGVLGAFDIVNGNQVATAQLHPNDWPPTSIEADPTGARLYTYTPTQSSGPRLSCYAANLQPLWADSEPLAAEVGPCALHVASDGGVYGIAVTQYTANSSLRVRKLDQQSGAPLWSTSVAGIEQGASAAAYAASHDRLLVVGRRRAQPPSHDAVRYAFVGASGALASVHDTATEGSKWQQSGDAVLAPDGARMYAATTTLQPRLRATLRGLATADGANAWTRSFDLESFQWFGSQLDRALAADEQRVFAITSREPYVNGSNVIPAVRALDGASGATLWEQTSFGLPADYASAELALVDANAIVLASSIAKPPRALQVHAFDAATGAALAATYGPLVADAGVYGWRPRLAAIPGSSHYAVAYSASSTPPRIDVERREALTGAPQWTATLAASAGETIQALVQCAVSADGGAIYTLELTRVTLPGPVYVRVRKLDAATGQQSWSSLTQYESGAPVQLALAPDHQRVAVGFSDPLAHGWRVALYAAATGQVLWNQALAHAAHPATPAYLAALAFDATGSKLYAGGSTLASASTAFGRFASGAYDVATATPLWFAELSNSTGSSGAPCRLLLHPDGKQQYAVGTSPHPLTSYDFVALGLALPELVGTPSAISLAAGGEQRFDLAPGAAYANDIAWIVGTTSGTAPGFQLGSLLLPLNVDAYTLFTAQVPNSPVLPDSLGQFDAHAHRTAKFRLPQGSDPALSGLVGHHAYLVFDAQTLAIVAVSNPIEVKLL